MRRSVSGFELSAFRSFSFAGLWVAALLATCMISTWIGCGGGAAASNSGPGATPTPTPVGTPTASPTPRSSATPTPTATPIGGSCAGIPITVNQGPTSGVAPFPAPAPEPPPSPGSTSAGSVCVSLPGNGAQVNSPVHIVAAATLANPVDHTRIYVDGLALYFSFSNAVDALMFMDPGLHTVELLSTDKNGNNVSSTFQVNVVASQNGTVSNIQNIPNWEPCSALYPPGHPRAGQVCAAGEGDAVATMTEGQKTPSLSGSSAKFTIAGPTAYSNELWTKYMAGGNNVTRFVYDLYFMVDNPSAPQALEFDVNQTFGNNRWVFGTECNFQGTAVNGKGEWDVWDSATGWKPTTVPCLASDFTANTWNHLVWTFERVGSQVHYVSVQVNNQVYSLNLYYSNEPGWTMEDIDVAFQMDGNFKQEPYTVWLDNVTLKVE